jgi:hypothetical protein
MGENSLPSYPETKRRFGLLVGAALVFSAAPLVLTHGSSSFTVYGNSLMVSALILFILAWVIHLKSDGLDFLAGNNNKNPSEPAESWKDRVPKVGAPPPQPYLIAADPPKDSAEQRLRNKILGIREQEPPRIRREKSRVLIADCLLAGSVVLAISLIFQYLIR